MRIDIMRQRERGFVPCTVYTVLLYIEVFLPRYGCISGQRGGGEGGGDVVYAQSDELTTVEEPLS